MAFEHSALDLQADRKLVYTAMSKHLFYFRMHVSKYVFEEGYVPLNPFMISEYFMLDTVDRNVIREANNTLVKRADEIWVFGPVSNGVLAEIQFAKGAGRNIRYFKIEKSSTIIPIDIGVVEMEDEVKEFKDKL